ncbi:hypothetical protein KC363_g127 [Hortaea werneckii]|nr:hypothetical protein KC363_g127 [Hortaea werneckii]
MYLTSDSSNGWHSCVSAMASARSKSTASRHVSLQNTTSQSGQATTPVASSPPRSGKSALQASHSASCNLLFAVSMDVSSSTMSFGCKSCFANTPSCVLIAGSLSVSDCALASPVLASPGIKLGQIIQPVRLIIVPGIDFSPDHAMVKPAAGTAFFLVIGLCNRVCANYILQLLELGVLRVELSAL